MFREIQMILPDHTVFINLQYHTARAHEQAAVLFLRQFPRLLRSIVDNDFANGKGMMIHQAVIAAHQIRSGLFCLFQKLLIIIRRYPVVTVDEADPFAFRVFQSHILRTTLAQVHRIWDHADQFRITFLII